MGDRSVTVFKSGDEFSCGIYQHWTGDNKDSLQKAMHRFRTGDPSYAAARFCGMCHEQIDGILSLGLWDAPTDEDAAKKFSTYADEDQGLFLVDISRRPFVVDQYVDGECVDSFTLNAPPDCDQ